MHKCQNHQTKEEKYRKALPESKSMSQNISNKPLQLKPELPKAGGMHARPFPSSPATTDERRKQLEEWLAAKGRIYKRPPMRLLMKHAVIPSSRKVKTTECLKLIEEPAEDLGEVALNILKDAGLKLEGAKEEEDTPREPTTPCLTERHPVASTPGLVGRHMTSLPPSVKLQVMSASRGREFLEYPEFKFLTPVRRSLRIERARSHYPEMLQDHDPVVSSLSEIQAAEEETRFFFRKNKALPDVTELEGLSSYPPKSPRGSGMK